MRPRAIFCPATITNGYFRARALTGLAPCLTDDQWPAILTRALDAATAITDDYDRAQALTGLAPHLPPDLQPAILTRALNTGITITTDHDHARALTALAPHLPADQLTRALEAAPEDIHAFLAVLARGESFLATHAGTFVSLMRSALRGSERPVCLSVIGGTASSLNKMGGTRAVDECASAVADSARWWP
jgi:hypothetical protein